jgi:hypothetical protein
MLQVGDELEFVVLSEWGADPLRSQKQGLSGFWGCAALTCHVHSELAAIVHFAKRSPGNYIKAAFLQSEFGTKKQSVLFLSSEARGSPG